MSNARLIRRTQISGRRASSHSQIRITRQPEPRNVCVTSASRRRFEENLCRQSFALRLGLRFRPQPWPCQKQPSTNTTSFDFGKTKSGLPNKGKSRFQPCSWAERRSDRSFNSVVAFRLLRTRDMRSERDKLPNDVVSVLGLPGQDFTVSKHFGQCFADGLSEQWRDGVPNLLYHLRTIPRKLKLIIE